MSIQIFPYHLIKYNSSCNHTTSHSLIIICFGKIVIKLFHYLYSYVIFDFGIILLGFLRPCI